MKKQNKNSLSLSFKTAHRKETNYRASLHCLAVETDFMGLAEVNKHKKFKLSLFKDRLLREVLIQY